MTYLLNSSRVQMCIKIILIDTAKPQGMNGFSATIFRVWDHIIRWTCGKKNVFKKGMNYTK